MALGDKLPVVMGKEKAVANGVATLGADGKLAEAQRPTTDATPAQGSANPVQSGGVYTALAGKADLTLSNLSNYQKALHNIGGRPSRNLLDNWYFVGGGAQQGGGQFPINQRGQTSYAGEGYCIDTWMITGTRSALTVDEDGVTFSVSADDTVRRIFEQRFEDGILKDGLDYTLSVLLQNGELYSGTAQFPTTFGTHTDAFTIPEIGGGRLNVNKDGGKTVYFIVNQGSILSIRAAKLELGPTQTLAYQDEDGNWQLFETPDYGEELAKCQRYYLPIDTRGKFPAVFSSPSTTLQVFVPTPVTMRVNPTVQGITSISARVYSGAANSQSLSISQTLLTEAGVLITFSVTWPSTLNPYSCAIVVFGQDGALSAEL